MCLVLHGAERDLRLGGGQGLSESLSLDGSLGSDRANHIAPTGPLKMFSSVGF